MIGMLYSGCKELVDCILWSTAMDELSKKLEVLSRIAHTLNESHVLWAVGGSMLLYFKGKTDVFHDIDLMVGERDIEKAKSLLLLMGTLSPQNPDNQYKTRHFLEFNIDGIDVDVMAGFVIVNNGKDYDCSLSAEQVAEHIPLNGEMIPLQALSDWRKYYELMGRTSKVEMIDK